MSRLKERKRKREKRQRWRKRQEKRMQRLREIQLSKVIAPAQGVAGQTTMMEEWWVRLIKFFARIFRRGGG